MAQKQHLTNALAKRLAGPARGKVIYVDDEVVGFGLRVTAAGARSFILRYTTRAGRERVLTVGSAGDWMTTAARAEAKRLRLRSPKGHRRSATAGASISSVS